MRITACRFRAAVVAIARAAASPKLRQATIQRFRYLSTLRDIEELGSDFAVPAGLRPSAAYAHLAAAGKVIVDAKQQAALTLLDTVHARVVEAYPAATQAASPPAAASRALSREPVGGSGGGGFGLFRSLFGGGSSSGGSAPAAPTRRSLPGLYLYGGPGCGKTFVMDLFYRCLPASHRLKRRVHFHAFMLDVHARMHAVRSSGNRGDPIAVVAAQLAADAAVVCFDEMQVTDVGDAMILRRLFDGLFAGGTTVVATSNRPPRQLYYNGLQRELFLPFIDLLEMRCRVHDMNSGTDYRQHLAQTLLGHTWIVAMHAADHGAAGTVGRAVAGHAAAGHPSIEAAWRRCCDGETESRTTTLATQGRRVTVPRAAAKHQAARFTFEELCSRPLGAADYQVLCQHFATILIDAVPILTLQQRNELRRFITFVDTAYEHRVKLIASAAAPPMALFQPNGPGGDESSAASGAGGARAAYDEAFAFDRTASRLMEMQSQSYLESEWRPRISTVGALEPDTAA